MRKIAGARKPRPEQATWPAVKQDCPQISGTSIQIAFPIQSWKGAVAVVDKKMPGMLR